VILGGVPIAPFRIGDGMPASLLRKFSQRTEEIGRLAAE
jgi:hypothetical protein